MKYLLLQKILSFQWHIYIFHRKISNYSCFFFLHNSQLGLFVFIKYNVIVGLVVDFLIYIFNDIRDVTFR